MLRTIPGRSMKSVLGRVIMDQVSGNVLNVRFWFIVDLFTISLFVVVSPDLYTSKPALTSLYVSYLFIMLSSKLATQNRRRINTT
jgi:hypothetical protein